MTVYLPSTFPYSRPIITIDDPSFLGRHPCIMLNEHGIEVHFKDNYWKPWMHASELVVQAISFLRSIEKRRSNLWKRLEAFRNLMRGYV